MNTRKINLLPVLQQVSEETNVLVERNGTACRVPAGAFGGGLIEKLAPTFTKTAPVVTCNPVEGYPLDVVSRLAYSRSQNLITAYGTNIADYSEPTLALELPAGKYFLWYKGESALRVSANTEDNVLVHIAAAFEKETETTINHPGGMLLITDTEWMTTFDESNLILTKAMTSITSVSLIHNGKTTTVDFPVTVSGGSFNWSTGVLSATEKGDEYTEGIVITHQLTPHEILGLSGVNTLSSNTGDTEVRGRADPTAMFAEQEARIAALEAALLNG